MRYTVLQLTDLHIGATWGESAVDALAAAVTAIRRCLPAAPDAVLVSGDIAHTGADAEYALARAELDRLGAPLYVIPGNHDDRAGLGRHFEVRASDLATLSYVADVGPLRLVALDTQRPGSASGQLDESRLAWLDGALAEARCTPTLLAMHHPPLVTGIPAMDAIGIPVDERRALTEIVTRHPQVQVIATGHVHRTIVGRLGAATVLAIPSTSLQLALDFEADEVQLVREPPCFALHLLLDGSIVSHVQPVDSAPA
jgi:Icc protein